jgi:hypothetical protein
MELGVKRKGELGSRFRGEVRDDDDETRNQSGWFHATGAELDWLSHICNVYGKTIGRKVGVGWKRGGG